MSDIQSAHSADDDGLIGVRDVEEAYGRVTLSVGEHRQLLEFVQGYYRLLAEDEGTWADWARRLADALQDVLCHPLGGHEQANEYMRAQGHGISILAAYRRTQGDHSDGDAR